jgi:hypothetical protein
MTPIELKTIGQRTSEQIQKDKEEVHKSGVIRRIVIATVYTGKAYVLDEAEETLLGYDEFSEALYNKKTMYQRRAIASTRLADAWIKFEQMFSGGSKEYVRYLDRRLKEVEVNREIRNGERSAVVYDAHGKVNHTKRGLFRR